jgi:LysM repeat protein
MVRAVWHTDRDFRLSYLLGGMPMRNRLALTTLIALLVLLTLALTGCERDRPVPTPQGTTSPAEGTVAAPATPVGDMTQVALPTVSTSEGGQTTAATPVPIGAASATPPPVATNVTTTQGGTGGTSGETGASGSSGTSSATGNVYITVAGDTLNEIARKLGVTTQALLAANPSITNPDNLKVGQQINIPSAQAGSTGSTGSTGQGPSTVYVVQQGDTLSSIAQRFGVSRSQLQQLNDITNPDQIYVGQQLLMPATTTAPAQSEGGTTYVVQRGDTLNSIAVRHGVTVAQMQKANNISDPDKIYPGQVLVIP